LEGGHSCPPYGALDKDAPAASLHKGHALDERAKGVRRVSVAKQRDGYILFETLIAIIVLSVGIVVTQNAIRQAAVVRSLSRDYTQVRFLLEQKLSELEMAPLLTESTSHGQFNGDNARFSWTYKISRVNLPQPTTSLIPGTPPPELPAAYMTKIQVSVSWTRSGQAYTETLETLWGPEKLWLPRSGT